MLVPSKFVVSAPGKVILFGEHSVVYGKPVLAVSIDKRTTLVFESTSSDFIELEFSQINLSTTIPVNLFVTSDSRVGDTAARPLDENELLNRSETDIDKLQNCQHFDRNQRISLRCVLYLIRGLLAGRNNLGSFKITVTSELKIGAGTGSSASFSVCLAAALFHYLRVIYSADSEVENLEQFSEKDKECINSWALACEQIIHGKASGIDNTVCTYGQVVKLITSEKNGCKTPIVLDNIIPLRILLVNTGIGRNTEDLIKIVTNRHSTHSAVVDLILEAMSEVVNSACSTLKSLKLHQNSTDDGVFRYLFSELECLISLNHGLLVSLGVSHEALDNIINITKNFKLSSKLTGAGGGGYAITLVPPFIPEDVVLNCTQALESSGYVVDDIIVGTYGVDFKT